MEIFNIKNLNFSYPETDKYALKNINLNVKSGEVLIICGKSGCGKTTLLSLLKPCQAPYGEKSGKILFAGKDISSLSPRRQSAKIGYVMQKPDRQIVTDKVWHELAFGCENLGLPPETIRRRVAETANFLGIDRWFDKTTAQLSGGQKQLLNLASVMTMQPEVLILDEPTSALDPIAAADFLNSLWRINSELGTTVIIAEHRTENIFEKADRTVFMDKGEIVAVGETREILKNIKNEFEYFLPTPAKVSRKLSGEKCLLTVKEGRNLIMPYKSERQTADTEVSIKRRDKSEYAVTVKNAYFRYSKNGEDILKDCNFSLEKGKICAVIGGNGSGKSTFLKAIAGINKIYSGKIRTDNVNPLYLPQNAELLFGKDTVYEELSEMCSDKEKIQSVSTLCNIENLFEQNPYDLSAGQGQCVALAKILLKNGDLLLLDEVTKGMDPVFKKQFGNILKSLVCQGKTVILVSHDLEFCAEFRDLTAMFFNGGVVVKEEPKNFFADNNFYTTSRARMAKGILPGAVTPEEIIKLCTEKSL